MNPRPMMSPIIIQSTEIGGEKLSTKSSEIQTPIRPDAILRYYQTKNRLVVGQYSK